MKNKKRIMAVALAAAMMLTNVAGSALPYVGAAESASCEEVSSGAGIEAALEDDVASEDDGAVGAAEEETATTQAMEAETEASPEENVEQETEEENEETEGTEEKATDAVQEYIVVAKNKRAYERTEDEYGNLEEGTEEEGEDGQLLEENNILVAEMTGEEAEELEEKRDILLVEENITFEGSGFEEDTGLPDELEEEMQEVQEMIYGDHSDTQWNTDMVNADEKEYGQGRDEISIAILDTGVCASDEIAIEEHVNYTDDESELLFEDISGHGTSVASVIGAKDNGRGIIGINPNAKLYSVKVLDDDKKASLSSVIQGIYWCIENHIDIINMSFGTDVKSEILGDVIRKAERAGILMVAAAGNNGDSEEGSTVQYPAAYEGVIAVGAVAPDGTVSEISSIGEEIDLLAPGEMIPGIGFFDEVVETYGTSMAAPHVAGVASVLWSKDRSKSAKFIKELMMASANRSGSSDTTGNGVLDLNYALEIYDAFSAGYSEDIPSEIIEESVSNEKELDVFDENELRANWHMSDHAEAVKTVVSSKDFNDVENGKDLIIKAVKVSDSDKYGLKFKKGETNSLHGHMNYVRGCYYLVKIARKCWYDGIGEAMNFAEEKSRWDETTLQIYNCIVNYVKKEETWNTIFGTKYRWLLYL